MIGFVKAVSGDTIRFGDRVLCGFLTVTRNRLKTLVSGVGPFTVHLNDGRSYLIKHPDRISYSPNNREMTVHDEQGVHYIDMCNLSEVHVPRSSADASSNGG